MIELVEAVASCKLRAIYNRLTNNNNDDDDDTDTHRRGIAVAPTDAYISKI
jgi:hypothetical protein